MLFIGQRVTWAESREQSDGSFETFFTIAQFTGDGWIFSERSSFEVRWFDIGPTKKLVKRAETESALPAENTENESAEFAEQRELLAV